jgi:hypothetical protein
MGTVISCISPLLVRYQVDGLRRLLVVCHVPQPLQLPQAGAADVTQGWREQLRPQWQNSSPQTALTRLQRGNNSNPFPMKEKFTIACWVVIVVEMFDLPIACSSERDAFIAPKLDSHLLQGFENSIAQLLNRWLKQTNNKKSSLLDLTQSIHDIRYLSQEN